MTRLQPIPARFWVPGVCDPRASSQVPRRRHFAGPRIGRASRSPSHHDL